MRFTWKSFLPYKLTFDMVSTNVQKPFCMEGITFGQLEGEGEWRFKEQDGITILQYNWDVNTTKK